MQSACQITQIPCAQKPLRVRSHINRGLMSSRIVKKQSNLRHGAYSRHQTLEGTSGEFQFVISSSSSITHAELTYRIVHSEKIQGQNIGQRQPWARIITKYFICLWSPCYARGITDLIGSDLNGTYLNPEPPLSRRRPGSRMLDGGSIPGFRPALE